MGPATSPLKGRSDARDKTKLCTAVVHPEKDGADCIEALEKASTRTWQAWAQTGLAGPCGIDEACLKHLSAADC